MLELGAQIIAEQPRARDAGGVDARLVQPRKGARRKRGGAVRIIVDPQFGISEATVGAGLRVGLGPVLDIVGKRAAEVVDGAVENGLELVEDRLDVWHDAV